MRGISSITSYPLVVIMTRDNFIECTKQCEWENKHKEVFNII